MKLINNRSHTNDLKYILVGILHREGRKNMGAEGACRLGGVQVHYCRCCECHLFGFPTMRHFHLANCINGRGFLVVRSWVVIVVGVGRALATFSFVNFNVLPVSRVARS